METPTASVDTTAAVPSAVRPTRLWATTVPTAGVPTAGVPTRRASRRAGRARRRSGRDDVVDDLARGDEHARAVVLAVGRAGQDVAGDHVAERLAGRRLADAPARARSGDADEVGAALHASRVGPDAVADDHAVVGGEPHADAVARDHVAVLAGPADGRAGGAADPDADARRGRERALRDAARARGVEPDPVADDAYRRAGRRASPVHDDVGLAAERDHVAAAVGRRARSHRGRRAERDVGRAAGPAGRVRADVDAPALVADVLHARRVGPDVVPRDDGPGGLARALRAVAGRDGDAGAGARRRGAARDDVALAGEPPADLRVLGRAGHPHADAVGPRRGPGRVQPDEVAGDARPGGTPRRRPDDEHARVPAPDDVARRDGRARPCLADVRVFGVFDEHAGAGRGAGRRNPAAGEQPDRVADDARAGRRLAAEPRQPDAGRRAEDDVAADDEARRAGSLDAHAVRQRGRAGRRDADPVSFDDRARGLGAGDLDPRHRVARDHVAPDPGRPADGDARGIRHAQADPVRKRRVVRADAEPRRLDAVRPRPLHDLDGRDGEAAEREPADGAAVGGDHEPALDASGDEHRRAGGPRLGRRREVRLRGSVEHDRPVDDRQVGRERDHVRPAPLDVEQDRYRRIAVVCAGGLDGGTQRALGVRFGRDGVAHAVVGVGVGQVAGVRDDQTRVAGVDVRRPGDVAGAVVPVRPDERPAARERHGVAEQVEPGPVGGVEPALRAPRLAVGGEQVRRAARVGGVGVADDGPAARERDGRAETDAGPRVGEEDGLLGPCLDAVDVRRAGTARLGHPDERDLVADRDAASEPVEDASGGQHGLLRPSAPSEHERPADEPHQRGPHDGAPAAECDRRAELAPGGRVGRCDAGHLRAGPGVEQVGRAALPAGVVRVPDECEPVAERDGVAEKLAAGRLRVGQFGPLRPRRPVEGEQVRRAAVLPVLRRALERCPDEGDPVGEGDRPAERVAGRGVGCDEPGLLRPRRPVVDEHVGCATALAASRRADECDVARDRDRPAKRVAGSGVRPEQLHLVGLRAGPHGSRHLAHEPRLGTCRHGEGRQSEQKQKAAHRGEGGAHR